MAAQSAVIGAGSVVQGAGQSQWRPSQEDDHRSAGAQAAGGAVEICDCRRRHRGRYCEEHLKGDQKRLKQSTGTRSVSADPSGRTEPVHGLKSRYQEWSRPPEPRPPQVGYWCSRFARRPNVRLIWCGNDQIMATGSDLGYRNNDRSFTYARLNLTPLTWTSPCEDWSLTSLKEKLIKIGAKVVRHGRYVIFQMAEVAIPRQMFQEILRLIAELRPQPPPAPA